jgi:hypothetical protein
MSQREWDMCKTCGGVGIVLEDTVVSDWEVTPGQVQETVDLIKGDGTVDFLAAMKAAREGKRVRPAVRPVNDDDWYYWASGNLRRDDFEKPRAFICEGHLDARWEVEQPPPREYTFLEAVELMKAGKKMKPKSWGSARSVWVNCLGQLETQHGQSSQLLYAEYLTEPWVEVTA